MEIDQNRLFLVFKLTDCIESMTVMDDCCFGLMGISKVVVLVYWIAAAQIIEIFVFLDEISTKHHVSGELCSEF